jgi:hypothetical protein
MIQAFAVVSTMDTQTRTNDAASSEPEPNARATIHLGSPDGSFSNLDLDPPSDSSLTSLESWAFVSHHPLTKRQANQKAKGDVRGPRAFYQNFAIRDALVGSGG